ncbi:hypothetical protein BESB_005130 [Besnoitia besnoiti]|uniref:Uncharacterized protein n=1 Tax=Besnoitia besnoiti TaxID=94643 RepID=A0A2A9MQB8_BESBE|nr:hypothetical protein BESB_005130 [Besnoitia besnoiti]PFH38172.1 hypothetical protein BESB_005130 [Besnoitia besnoiti]
MLGNPRQDALSFRSLSIFRFLPLLFVFLCTPFLAPYSVGAPPFTFSEGVSRTLRQNPVWFSFDDTSAFSYLPVGLSFSPPSFPGVLSRLASASTFAFGFRVPSSQALYSSPHLLFRCQGLFPSAATPSSFFGHRRRSSPQNGAGILSWCSPAETKSASPAQRPHLREQKCSDSLRSPSEPYFAHRTCSSGVAGSACRGLSLFSSSFSSSLSTCSRHAEGHRGSRAAARRLHARSAGEGEGSSAVSGPAPSQPRRALSSVLLSNLKAEQKRLREAREEEEKERAQDAEAEKKREARARLRKAREALLINKKKQRKETHRVRVLRAAARRRYLAEKRERMDRVFLEDTQVQRSTERSRVGGGEASRAKKAKEIQMLKDLVESSALVIQLEAHGLTPNQRWSIVRGLALAGFYKGYRIKHGKNSYMRVALRRIIAERKQRQENQTPAQQGGGDGSAAASSQSLSSLAQGSTAPQDEGNRAVGRTQRGSLFPAALLGQPPSAVSASESSSLSSASSPSSALAWRPSVRRVRRDFWISHNEELAFKAAAHRIDISGKKVKRALAPEEEEIFAELEAEDSQQQSRVAARLERNLESAVWKDDPRFAHLAIGMKPGGVWTQWEDDEELDEEKAGEMPADLKDGDIPYMEVDDWKDLFEDEIRRVREAKQEARAREKEMLSTMPLEGEVTSVAENGENMMKYLSKTNLYLFVRAMPRNEQRLSALVRTLIGLLDEIVFDNRVKRERKGPPPRKYKSQWYDEELLPHVTPEIAASMGFSPLAQDGRAPKKRRSATGIPPGRGSIIGVTQRLASSVQAVPSLLASATNDLVEQKKSTEVPQDSAKPDGTR